jgi:cyclopropane-fatty-acyl-phospholipid synthase
MLIHQFPKKSLAKLFPNSFELAQKIVIKVLRPMNKGQLTVFLPSGEKLIFGQSPEQLQAEMIIHSPKFFQELILAGELALGDGHVDQLWDSSDVTAVIRWFILNLDQGVDITGSKRSSFAPINLLKGAAILGHKLRANSVRVAKQNIEAHYDLSNPFYQTFLDETMTYSSAYFKTGNESLKEAQEAKIDRLLDLLNLKPEEHLLEIGSGWGALAIRAAERYQVRVTTITLSNEQFSYTQELIRQKGLQERITLKLCDYRELEGEFDKIVSVEMIEAVGHEYYEVFFKKCSELLTPKGVLALQAITYPHARYEAYRKGVDWIQKEIFPGGHLPSVAVMCEGLARAGEFEIRDLKDLGLHYAKTLQHWHQRLNQRVEDIKKLGLDETFLRKWRYYFSYCEAGFLERHVSAVQVVFARPNTPWHIRL